MLDSIDITAAERRRQRELQRKAEDEQRMRED